MINVCPWSPLNRAGRCSWRAGKHCRPTHLHPGTCWTTCCGIIGLTELNGTRRWPCWPALCPEAKRGFCIGPSKVENARVAHGGPSCGGGGGGGARGIAVGSKGWGGWVCRGVFYGEHGGKCVGQWSRGIGRYVSWIEGGGGPLRR